MNDNVSEIVPLQSQVNDDSNTNRASNTSRASNTNSNITVSNLEDNTTYCIDIKVDVNTENKIDSSVNQTIGDFSTVSMVPINESSTIITTINDNNANNNNNKTDTISENSSDTQKNSTEEANSNVKNIQTSDDKATKPAYEVLTKQEKRLVYLALCLGMFLAALDQLVVTVALPTIARLLGGETYLSWVLASYMATSSASMPLYGKYSDIYGRRPVFEFALIWFFIGSIICGSSPNIACLIAGRTIQGIGGGGLLSLCMVLIGDIAKPSARTKYFSSLSLIVGLATVLGPVIGGIFTEYVSWRWIFFINAPLVGITIIASWFLLGKIQNSQQNLPVDTLGSIFIIIATACLVLLITWAGTTYAWSSYQIIILLFAIVIFFSLFVFQEFRHPEPIMNFRLFKIRNLAVTSIVTFLFGMSMLGIFAFIPFYFQDVRGDSVIISGLKIIPVVIGIILGSTPSGMYISKTGKYIVFPTLGMGIFSIGTGLLILMSTTTNYWLEAFYLFIVGSGIGISFPVFNAIVQNCVPPRDMASSISSITFIRQIAGGIGVTIFGRIYSQDTILNLRKGDNIEEALSQALHNVFIVTCACSVLGFIVAFGIQNVQLFSKAPKPGKEDKSNIDNDVDEAAQMAHGAMI